MLTTDEDRLFEILDQDTCRQRLDASGTGRLGFTDGALPVILPVPFALQDGDVMIPAHRDSPVLKALRGAVVAFEVDSYDAATRTGWSVTVVGPTRVVSHAAEVAALQLRFSTHPPTTDRCYIAVLLGLLRGWQLSECPTVPGSAGTGAAVSSPR